MPYYSYYAGDCQNCGEPMGIQEVYGGRQRLYCSDKCRKAAHRAKKQRAARLALLSYNSELRQLWDDNEIKDPVLARLQDMLVEHGKDAAKQATETVILACKLLQHDLTGRGMLRR
jgi:hypothetical protein